MPTSSSKARPTSWAGLALSRAALWRQLCIAMTNMDQATLSLEYRSEAPQIGSTAEMTCELQRPSF